MGGWLWSKITELRLRQHDRSGQERPGHRLAVDRLRRPGRHDDPGRHRRGHPERHARTWLPCSAAITPAPAAAAGRAGTTVAGGINVTINFVGGTPTVAEATQRRPGGRRRHHAGHRATQRGDRGPDGGELARWATTTRTAAHPGPGVGADPRRGSDLLARSSTRSSAASPTTQAATQRIRDARFYVNEIPAPPNGFQIAVVNLYPYGTEDQTGPIRQIIIPATAGRSPARTSPSSTAASVAEAVFIPGDSKYIEVRLQLRHAAAASACSSPVNSYPELANKRILNVSLLYSGAINDQDPVNGDRLVHQPDPRPLHRPSSTR